MYEAARTWEERRTVVVVVVVGFLAEGRRDRKIGREARVSERRRSCQRAAECSRELERRTSPETQMKAGDWRKIRGAASREAVALR